MPESQPLLPWGVEQSIICCTEAGESFPVVINLPDYIVYATTTAYAPFFAVRHSFHRG